MRYNVDAWQIIHVPNRHLSQGLIFILGQIDNLKIFMPEKVIEIQFE